jgi:sugar lactone lactonase YvrE
LILFQYVTDSSALLGEGISISLNKEYLCWVDILNHKVYFRNLTTHEELCIESWKFPSCTFQDESQWIYVAHFGGIDRWNRVSGKIENCTKWLEYASDLRCNDGKMDAFGNIWISTMSINHDLNQGAVWVWNRKGNPKLLLNGISIPNSIAVNWASGLLYFADSQLGDIFKCKVEADLNLVGKPSLHFSNQKAAGIPDGSCLDSGGNLWNARWDGGCVISISPEGQLLESIQVPHARPTSVAIEDNELFVTFAESKADQGTGRTGKLALPN